MLQADMEDFGGRGLAHLVFVEELVTRLAAESLAGS